MARLSSAREERQEVVASLRDAGLSTRAIAAATGVDQKTVVNDLHAGEENSSPDDDEIVEAEIVEEPTVVTGIDGGSGRQAEAVLTSKVGFHGTCCDTLGPGDIVEPLAQRDGAGGTRSLHRTHYWDILDDRALDHACQWAETVALGVKVRSPYWDEFTRRRRAVTGWGPPDRLLGRGDRPRGRRRSRPRRRGDR